METVIETEEQLEEWIMDGPDAVQFATNPEGPWIIYCGDDGDEWYALRPLFDDDPLDSYAGVLKTVDNLELPLTIMAAGR